MKAMKQKSLIPKSDFRKGLSLRRNTFGSIKRSLGGERDTNVLEPTVTKVKDACLKNGVSVPRLFPLSS